MDWRGKRDRVHKPVALLLMVALVAGVVAASAQEGLGEQGVASGAILNPGTIYVDREAIGANDGSSWEDAFVDLQLALDAALPGDDIWVAAGTYYPSVEHGGVGERYKSFQMLNGAGIYGGFDPSVGDVGWDDRDWVANETILSGDLGVPGDNSDNCYHVFYHPEGTDLDATAVLDGFTVTGGYGDGGGEHSRGGGMYTTGSPTLANCTFSVNEVVGPPACGGGLFSNGSPSLTNCTFSGNVATGSGWGGGGMCSHGSATLAGCTFIGNTAQYGGGISVGGSARLANCAFVANSAEHGGGAFVPESSEIVLTHCTFTGNTASVHGGAICNTGDWNPGYIWAVNSVLWGDTPDEIFTGGAAITYSDIQGGWDGEGNIDGDPLFVDPDGGDLHLSNDSPCIDAGTNEAPGLPVYDFEGDPRIMDGDGDGTPVADMGVDEVDGPYPPQPPDLYPIDNPEGDGDYLVAWTEVLFAAGYTLEEDNDVGFPSPTERYSGSDTQFLVSGQSDGVWFYRVRASNQDGDSPWSEVKRTHVGPPLIVYVDADATGVGDGTSWESAYTDLQDGLDAAVVLGDEVWVAAGTYAPSNEFGDDYPRSRSFQMKNEVAIYGGFDPSVGDVDWEDRDWAGNEAVLSGASVACSHVFYHPQGLALNSTAVLDGVTVTGGSGNGGGMYNEGSGNGGGMYNEGSSPIVSNCTFEGNPNLGLGGGMYNEDSSPILTNCTFRSNWAGYWGGGGGGMYNVRSSPVLTDCSFEENFSDGYGGGMYNDEYSSPVLTGCRFEGNSGIRGGGMCNASSSSPTLTNCTFSGNTALSEGGGMYNASNSSPTLVNCEFEANESPWYADGGGMYNDDSSPTLTNCTFSRSYAGLIGGGMYNTGSSSPTLTNCSFQGNTVDNTGGGYTARATPHRC